MKQFIPNQSPTAADFAKIAIINYKPSQQDFDFGQIFCDYAGNILDAVLNDSKLTRRQVFVGNLIAGDPTALNISAWRQRLFIELQKFKPNIVVLLGGQLLAEAGETRKLTEMRGTIFTCNDPNSPFAGYKCIATYAPKDILIQWDYWPYLQFDIRKAVKHSTTDHFLPPERVFDMTLSPDEICARLDAIVDGEVSLDIEGGGPLEGISCISFATSPHNAFIFVPSEYSVESQLRIIQRIQRLLLDCNVGKILQNALYDQFCLSWHWGTPILNITHDTMIGGWEIYPELNKGLGVLASIYTDEPCYKWQKKTKNQFLFWEYNCRDSTVTYEVAQEQRKLFTPAQREHFEFNMSVLPVAAYMTRKGILYDVENQKVLHDEVVSQMSVIMSSIETLVGGKVNLNSPKQLQELLYDRFKFEKQYEVVAGRKTNKVTTDRKALLKLAKKFDHPLVPLILQWKHFEGRRKQLVYTPDRYGRLRGMYNIVGTETGRFSCSISEKDKAQTRYPGGAPLHVINSANRKLFLADPGYYFFQCDLEGADGWTVAAHCDRLGHPTMLQDYLAGNKPAKIIAAMYLHQRGELTTNPSRLDARELAELCRTLPLPYWLYFACKRIQHGTNYLLGVPTMIVQILEDSYKLTGNPIHITKSDATLLQSLYLQRYTGVKPWQEWVANEIDRTSQLGSASGHIRTFFGRPRSHELYRTAVAQEPQANTTFVTNKAATNLFYDPENRTANHDLIIQPLHQVHDAICGQFPIEKLDWARTKIKSAFDFHVTIAGRSIRIPIEGKYGRSWGELTESL